MRHFLHEVRLSFGSIQALLLALVVAGAVPRATAQVGTGETVIPESHGTI